MTSERRALAGPKPYVSILELAQLTPWTEQAIRTMVARGKLKLGVHYFQPTGPRGQLVFAWQAIVEYIEKQRAAGGRELRLPGGVEVDLEAIRAQAAKLLD